MEISTELLVADLAQKLRRGLIDSHGANIEADIRGAIVSAQQKITDDNICLEHNSTACPDCARELREEKERSSAYHEDWKKAFALIADCQAVLTSYLPPDGITIQACINGLLELLDGPRSRAVLPIDKPRPPA